MKHTMFGRNIKHLNRNLLMKANQEANNILIVTFYIDRSNLVTMFGKKH